MRFTSAVAAGLAAVGALAGTPNYLGFNSGATLADRSAKFKKDFVAEFTTAANLVGSPGDFNAVRLYTNIQAYSEDDPIEAFDAAVETKTKVLLGIWASGVDNIDKEITALNKAIKKFGSDLTDLIIGVNVGSEDLYRVSKNGIKNKSGPGSDSKTLVGFIDDFRKAFKGSPIGSVPVGHADTWDAWDNSTNKAVIDAVDFLCIHEYPYYENDKGNDISNAGKLFDKAYNIAVEAAGGKPVWVTETGWPYVGPDWDEAEASVKNAKKYWQEVGCRKLFNKTPTFWYTLRDSNPDNKMKFAITKDLSEKPLFDLKCPTHFDTDESTSTSSSESSKPTKTGGNGGSSESSKGPDSSDSSSGPTSTADSATTMTSAGTTASTDASSTGGGSGGSSSSSGGDGATGSGSSDEAAATTGASEVDPNNASPSVKVSTFGILAAVGAVMAFY